MVLRSVTLARFVAGTYRRAYLRVRTRQLQAIFFVTHVQGCNSGVSPDFSCGGGVVPGRFASEPQRFVVTITFSKSGLLVLDQNLMQVNVYPSGFLGRFALEM